MKRPKLYKNQFDDFVRWLDKNKIEHHPGKGEYQALQVKCPTDQGGQVWVPLHSPLYKQEFTVMRIMEPLVEKFQAKTNLTTCDIRSLPLGSRIKYPKSPIVWTIISRRVHGSYHGSYHVIELAEWSENMDSIEHGWPNQELCLHQTNGTDYDQVIFID